MTNINNIGKENIVQSNVFKPNSLSDDEVEENLISEEEIKQNNKNLDIANPFRRFIERAQEAKFAKKILNNLRCKDGRAIPHDTTPRCAFCYRPFAITGRHNKLNSKLKSKFCPDCGELHDKLVSRAINFERYWTDPEFNAKQRRVKTNEE